MLTFDVLVAHEDPAVRLMLTRFLMTHHGWKVKSEENTQQASVHMTYEMPRLVIVSDLADTLAVPIETFLMGLRSSSVPIKSILIMHTPPIAKHADMFIRSMEPEMHQAILVAAEALLGV